MALKGKATGGKYRSYGLAGKEITSTVCIRVFAELICDPLLALLSLNFYP